MSDSGDEFEYDEAAAAAAAAAAEAEAAEKVKTAGKVAAKDNPMQQLIKRKQEKEAEHQAKLDKLLCECRVAAVAFGDGPVGVRP